MRHRFALVIVGLVLAGCSGSKAPTTPSPPVEIAGSWSGYLQFTFRSSASSQSTNLLLAPVTMSLTQMSASVDGTWTESFGLQASGTITGTVDSTTFTGTITYAQPNGPTCSGSFSGSAKSSVLNWSGPGFKGTCGLMANLESVRFNLQR